MILLDMVWPAIYVSQTFWRFWYLVIGTILIEWVVIKYFLHFSWKKSFYVSLIGNAVSGFAGTLIMTIAMIFWHLVVDNFVRGTFNTFNWVATFVFMCLGSVYLEIATIHIIYKEPMKRLFLPMLTGNFLSYAFIAWVMITPSGQDRREGSLEEMKYLPDKHQLVLLDQSELKIDTAIMRVWHTTKNERGNDVQTADYFMSIHFTRRPKTGERGVPFLLEMLDSSSVGWQNDDSCEFHFNKLKGVYKIKLDQRNPDTSYGWLRSVVTDTLTFKRILKW